MFNRDAQEATKYALLALFMAAVFLGCGTRLVIALYALVTDPSEIDVIRVPACTISTKMERVELRSIVRQYRIEVAYSFSFEGTEYTGSHMFPHEWGVDTWSKSDATTIAKGLEDANAVFIPHSDPSKAFLTYRSEWNWLGWIAKLTAGTLMGAIGTLIGFVEVRTWWRERRAMKANCA